MTKREIEILGCENRIALLEARPKENGKIIAKLRRRLRALQKMNDAE
jgi:hypothetical protein